MDQRLVNELLPDNPESKISVCAEKSYEIWKDTAAQKSAQLIFCDLSTPKGDGSFNVYDDLKQKLIEKGVPEKEIAFIHDANTEAKKTELFGKVKSGQVRFLIGSTAKMGAGTNVQDRLIALHHLDIGWKPSDVGQILRTFKIKKNVEVTDNGKIIIRGNGRQIRKAGRLPNPMPYLTRRGTTADRRFWKAALAVSQRIPQSYIHQSAHKRQA